MKKKWRLLGSVVLVAVLAWRIDWAQAGRPWPAPTGRCGRRAGRLPVRTGRQQPCAGGCWPTSRVSAGRTGRYLAYYFIGMFFNLVLPTSIGGDMVRTWYLVTREGTALPRGEAAGGGVPQRLRRPSQRPGRAGRGSVPGRRVLSDAAAAVAALDGRRPGRRDAGWACWPLPWLSRLPMPPGQLRWASGVRRRVSASIRGRVLAVTLLSFVVQIANVVLALADRRGAGAARAAGLLRSPGAAGGAADAVADQPQRHGAARAGTVVLLQPLGVGAAEAVTLACCPSPCPPPPARRGGVLLLGRFSAARGGSRR